MLWKNIEHQDEEVHLGTREGSAMIPENSNYPKCRVYRTKGGIKRELCRRMPIKIINRLELQPIKQYACSAKENWGERDDARFNGGIPINIPCFSSPVITG